MSGSVWAIVVAAGSGTRMGASRPKQFLDLAGRPLVAHALEALLAHPEVAGAVLAIPRGWHDFVRRRVLAGGAVRLVTGGATRAESVRRALAGLPAQAGRVLVHDGARPLVAADLVDRLLAALARGPAAIPGLPATDTLKEVTPTGRVRRTLDRRTIVAVQTPQAFRRDVLEAAYSVSPARLARSTDCASLVEAAGHRVIVVPGARENLKVTTTTDLALAEALLSLSRAARPVQEAVR